MITYDWNCKTVDVHPQEEGQENVVYNVHWRVTGTSDKLDSNLTPYSSDAIGTQIVPLDEDGAFIPFEDLTNEIVVGWTKEAMGEDQVDRIEASIASQIEEQMHPKSVTLTIGG
jgi:hypothetical protein